MPEIAEKRPDFRNSAHKRSTTLNTPLATTQRYQQQSHQPPQTTPNDILKRSVRSHFIG